MSARNILWGTLIAGVVLFVWSGLVQIFPWGVPSAAVLASQTEGQTEPFQAPNVQRLPANALTSPQFDAEMVNRVSTLITDNTFSWIVTKPLAYYNPLLYFAREFATQIAVGLLLTLVLILTSPLPNRQRLLIVTLAGILAAIATYGQLFNWWGLTIVYALGVSFNLVIGWIVVSFVLTRFVLKA
ncbi:hypothetical protein GC175_20540 [bacterium]|nr:hypothetical protein [bacterium]